MKKNLPKWPGKNSRCSKLLHRNMLQNVLGFTMLIPTSCAAEGNPAVQSMQAILHGSFGIKRSKTSTKSTKSTKIGSSSSPEPKPVLEKPQLCALVMERFDCSLFDLTFVNLTEPEVTSFARVRRLCVWHFGFHVFGRVKA